MSKRKGGQKPGEVCQVCGAVRPSGDGGGEARLWDSEGESVIRWCGRCEVHFRARLCAVGFPLAIAEMLRARDRGGR